MAADLEALTGRLLEAASAAGAEAADAIAVAGDSLSIEVRNGALEQAERAEGVDLGLRVLIGRRQACVSSSDIRDATLAAMAERAVAMAREAPEDPWCGLADPDELARGWDAAALDLEDPAPLPTPDGAAGGGARRRGGGAGGAGRQQDGRRRRRLVGRAACTSPRRNGFSGGYGRTGHSIQAVAICGEGTGDGARLRLREPQPPRRPAATRPRSAASPASAPRRAPAPASRRPAPFRCSTTSGSPPG